MMWKVFTYQTPEPVEMKAADGTIELVVENTLADWFETLLDGLRAEQVVPIGDNQYAIYFSSAYDDEFDKFGIKF
jgi:hypothetical protein